MTTLANVDNIEEARKAVQRYVARYGLHGAPTPLLGLAGSENFVHLVAALERQVTGEHPLDALSTALDHAVHYCVSLIEVLPEHISQELLWGSNQVQFNQGRKGV